MKILLIVAALLVLAGAANAQIVDTTTNANRVIFIYSLAQQNVMQAVYGPAWRGVVVQRSLVLMQNAQDTQEAQALLTKAVRDSIVYYRNRIDYLKSTVGQ